MNQTTEKNSTVQQNSDKNSDNTENVEIQDEEQTIYDLDTVENIITDKNKSPKKIEPNKIYLKKTNSFVRKNKVTYTFLDKNSNKNTHTLDSKIGIDKLSDNKTHILECNKVYLSKDSKDEYIYEYIFFDKNNTIQQGKLDLKKTLENLSSQKDKCDLKKNLSSLIREKEFVKNIKLALWNKKHHIEIKKPESFKQDEVPNIPEYEEEELKTDTEEIKTGTIKNSLPPSTESSTLKAESPKGIESNNISKAELSEIKEIDLPILETADLDLSFKSRLNLDTEDIADIESEDEFSTEATDKLQKQQRKKLKKEKKRAQKEMTKLKGIPRQNQKTEELVIPQSEQNQMPMNKNKNDKEYSSKRDEYFRKRYDLELMTSLPEKGKSPSAEKGKIYINPKTREYVVRDLKGNLHQLNFDEKINLENLKKRLNKDDLKNQILKFTSKRGHTEKGLEEYWESLDGPALRAEFKQKLAHLLRTYETLYSVDEGKYFSDEIGWIKLEINSFILEYPQAAYELMGGDKRSEFTKEEQYYQKIIGPLYKLKEPELLVEFKKKADHNKTKNSTVEMKANRKVAMRNDIRSAHKFISRNRARVFSIKDGKRILDSLKAYKNNKNLGQEEKTSVLETALKGLDKFCKMNHYKLQKRLEERDKKLLSDIKQQKNLISNLKKTSGSKYEELKNITYTECDNYEKSNKILVEKNKNAEVASKTRKANGYHKCMGKIFDAVEDAFNTYNKTCFRIKQNSIENFVNYTNSKVFNYESSRQRYNNYQGKFTKGAKEKFMRDCTMEQVLQELTRIFNETEALDSQLKKDLMDNLKDYGLKLCVNKENKYEWKLDENIYMNKSDLDKKELQDFKNFKKPKNPGNLLLGAFGDNDDLVSKRNPIFDYKCEKNTVTDLIEDAYEAVTHLPTETAKKVSFDNASFELDDNAEFIETIITTSTNVTDQEEIKQNITDIENAIKNTKDPVLKDTYRRTRNELLFRTDPSLAIKKIFLQKNAEKIDELRKNLPEEVINKIKRKVAKRLKTARENKPTLTEKNLYNTYKNEEIKKSETDINFLRDKEFYKQVFDNLPDTISISGLVNIYNSLQDKKDSLVAKMLNTHMGAGYLVPGKDTNTMKYAINCLKDKMLAKLNNPQNLENIEPESLPMIEKLFNHKTDYSKYLNSKKIKAKENISKENDKSKYLEAVESIKRYNSYSDKKYNLYIEQKAQNSGIDKLVDMYNVYSKSNVKNKNYILNMIQYTILEKLEAHGQKNCTSKDCKIEKRPQDKWEEISKIINQKPRSRIFGDPPYIKDKTIRKENLKFWIGKFNEAYTNYKNNLIKLDTEINKLETSIPQNENQINNMNMQIQKLNSTTFKRTKNALRRAYKRNDDLTGSIKDGVNSARREYCKARKKQNTKNIKVKYTNKSKDTLQNCKNMKENLRNISRQELGEPVLFHNRRGI